MCREQTLLGLNSLPVVHTEAPVRMSLESSNDYYYIILTSTLTSSELSGVYMQEAKRTTAHQGI